MKDLSKIVVLVIMTLFVVTEAHAERPQRRHHKRSMKRQARRINNAKDNGNLTRREARRLKKSGMRTRQMRKRFAADGDVTKFEKKRMRKHLKKRSHQIKRYNRNDKDRGDGKIDTPVEPVEIAQDGGEIYDN
jgi:hypothetical protein